MGEEEGKAVSQPPFRTYHFEDYTPPTFLLSLPHDSQLIKPMVVHLKVETIDDVPATERVCRFCFRMLENDDNILKTQCGCQPTLMHTECAGLHKWPSTAVKCDVCGRDIEFRKIWKKENDVQQPKIDQEPTSSKPKVREIKQHPLPR